ncbi:MAG: hypothetical protein F6K10_05400 [Moorea sp. SIO2B7]|nr:hypothetical protein [Moorena sp. SIO2B7]
MSYPSEFIYDIGFDNDMNHYAQVILVEHPPENVYPYKWPPIKHVPMLEVENFIRELRVIESEVNETGDASKLQNFLSGKYYEL